MSDKLILLRSEAKQSMQAMVDKAIFRDAASDHKRHLFRTSYRNIGASISFFMFCVCLYKVPEVESVRNNFANGMANFFKTDSRSMRELYAPEVYELDAKYRRQESQIFS